MQGKTFFCTEEFFGVKFRFFFFWGKNASCIRDELLFFFEGEVFFSLGFFFVEGGVFRIFSFFEGENFFSLGNFFVEGGFFSLFFFGRDFFGGRGDCWGIYPQNFFFPF